MSDDRNEDCRLAVLRNRAIRNGLSQAAGTINDQLRTEGCDFELVEVEDALGVLLSMHFVRKNENLLGNTLYYQITREGTIRHDQLFGTRTLPPA